MPCRCGFVGIRRTNDVEIGDGSHRDQMLDRLMGGSVFAQADAVVGEHIDRVDPHQAAKTDGWTHVVAEGEKGR